MFLANTYTCPILRSLTPFLYFWWYPSSFQSLGGLTYICVLLQRKMSCMFPEIHLWCNTCWPLCWPAGCRPSSSHTIASKVVDTGNHEFESWQASFLVDLYLSCFIYCILAVSKPFGKNNNYTNIVRTLLYFTLTSFGKSKKAFTFSHARLT